jgi:hypothetical protein
MRRYVRCVNTLLTIERASNREARPHHGTAAIDACRSWEWSVTDPDRPRRNPRDVNARRPARRGHVWGQAVKRINQSNPPKASNAADQINGIAGCRHACSAYDLAYDHQRPLGLLGPLPQHDEGSSNRSTMGRLISPSWRAGSVCLNSLRAVAKWISALVMPQPGLAAAR